MPGSADERRTRRGPGGPVTLRNPAVSAQRFWRRLRSEGADGVADVLGAQDHEHRRQDRSVVGGHPRLPLFQDLRGTLAVGEAYATGGATSSPRPARGLTDRIRNQCLQRETRAEEDKSQQKNDKQGNHPLFFAGNPGLQAGRECGPRPGGAKRRRSLLFGARVRLGASGFRCTP
jgi:hypothetical protein